MRISVITLFPEMFSGPFSSSIIGRAVKSGALTIDYIQLRDYATDRYKSVDDHPYGGGNGMILRVDVVDRALSAAKADGEKSRVILLDPQGAPYTQKTAKTLSGYGHLILLCGHYEGIDERIRSLVDEECSIGDYILTGGEIPAMVIIDSVARLLPGVLKKAGVTDDESFSSGMLEYPQYTRPETYNGMTVPDTLLSGNHAEIAGWRRDQAIARTNKRRPDLLK